MTNKHQGIKRLALLACVASALAGGAGSAAADELKVGVEIPLTGSLARVGSGMQEGINVAADVFNKTNGKHKIKLVTIDDESAPAKAIAAVEKLAGEGVLAITGGYGSNNIAPAADAAGKAGLVYMTSGGVDDNLVNSGRKNFFRINNTAGYERAVQGLLARHVETAKQRCPSLARKRVTPHVLRHTAAMELLQAGVDCSVIALWLGHESIKTTQVYLHAHLALKEAALAKVKPFKGQKGGRYKPGDRLLAFLDGL